MAALRQLVVLAIISCVYGAKYKDGEQVSCVTTRDANFLL